MIKITPQMIDAGERVVFDYRGISDDAELAERVFAAMLGGGAVRHWVDADGNFQMETIAAADLYGVPPEE